MEKLRALVGNEQVDLILAQGPEVIRARLDAFMQFESTLIGQVHDHSVSVVPTRPEPMDLSLAETDEEAEIRAVESHRNIRRCFTARQATSGRTPTANQKSGTVRENVDSQ
uniref:Uncharacterized protein n=1 Tax=Hyaloperonospora arabidopsidis (strain Emoy2) TaxID=559515 RepID=M4B7D5_HYAAE